MELTLTPDTQNAVPFVLCSDASRSSDGAPCGPNGLQIAEAPGVEMRELIGADRVAPERTGCDHGTMSFGVTRTFATPSAAADYALSGHLSEPVAGTLKNGQTTIWTRVAVTSRRIAQVGCTVSINYTIEG